MLTNEQFPVPVDHHRNAKEIIVKETTAMATIVREIIVREIIVEVTIEVEMTEVVTIVAEMVEAKEEQVLVDLVDPENETTVVGAIKHSTRLLDCKHLSPTS